MVQGLTRSLPSKLVAIGLLALFSETAHALPITVDAGAYPGSLYVQEQGTGQRTAHSGGGAFVADLAAGTHFLSVQDAAPFYFTVAVDGTVTSQNPVAASGGAGLLVLNTDTVVIDSAGYPGDVYPLAARTFPAAALPADTPVRTWTVVRGLNFYLTIQDAESFPGFTVAADGQVTSHRPDAAVGGANSLTLIPATVTIDAGSYPGDVYPLSARTFPAAALPADTPVRTWTVVQAVRFYLTIQDAESFPGFTVAPGGLVTSHRPAAAVGGQNRLTLQGTTITIDANGYPGSVYPLSARTFPAGALPPEGLVRTWPVVQAVRFYLTIQDAQSFPGFTVAPDGQVTSHRTAAATGGLGTLTLRTDQVTIDAQTFTGNVFVLAGRTFPPSEIPPEGQVRTWPVVRGVSFYIASPIRKRFVLDGEPCVVTPSEMEQDGHTILLRCGATNSAPLADAGGDRVLRCDESLVLDGSGSSDPDGDDLSYAWTGAFGIAYGASVDLGPQPVGTYVIELTVTDAAGAEDTDQITVSVVLCTCPRGQGFWKNHPAEWPVTSLSLGGVDYSQAELLDLFDTPPRRGDASLILAHQLIAAKLNVAAGGPSVAIAETIAAADALLAERPSTVPQRVQARTPSGQEMVRLAGLLEAYNESEHTCELAEPSGPAEPRPGSRAPAAPPAQPTPSTQVAGAGGQAGGSGGGGCALVGRQPSGSPAPYALLLVFLLFARRRAPR